MKLTNYSQYEIYPQEGKIWSYKRNRFIGYKQKDGYWQCTLISDDGERWKTYIHRVVWVACNGDIPQGYEINHIEENKDKNSVDDLELVTRKENINYGSRNERVAKANTNNPKRSKQVGAFKNGSLIMLFPSTAEAQRQGYSSGNVSSCCNGKLPHYKGYQWQYI